MGMVAHMHKNDILRHFEDHLSEEDYAVSATSQSLEQLVPMVSALVDHRDSINMILDLGCGHASLTAPLADLLNCDVVHGIELDPERRAVAEQRGVTTHDLNLESDPFPLRNGEVDLVVSFGVFEHLRYYDYALEESHRVLRDNGFILYSVPNLGSWVNRIGLLFGNQPRDVEISQQRAVGVSGFYANREFLNHIHSPTHDAFVELLEYHGYTVQHVTGLFPYQDRSLVQLVDKLVASRPSLCRRIAVLGTKTV